MSNKPFPFSVCKECCTGEGGGGGGVEIVVDQTYSPESENAQSGKAVAEAIESIGGGGSDVGQPTADGGEIFNNYTKTSQFEKNEAISTCATSSGRETLAGAKGFRIKSISGNVFTLDGENETKAAEMVELLTNAKNNKLYGNLSDILTDDQKEEYDTSIYSIRIKNQDFLNQGKITDITPSGKYIKVTVDNLPFTNSDMNNYTFQEMFGYTSNDAILDNTFFIVLAPEVGLIDRGIGAFSTGLRNGSTGPASFTSGEGNIAAGHASFAVGGKNKAGRCAVVGGYRNTASGPFSMAFGAESVAEKDCDIALGSQVKATGQYSFAANNKTTANGLASAAFGTETTASSINSVAFGLNTRATNSNAVAFGSNTTASGYESFACGLGTQAKENQAFAQGVNTIAGQFFSHAEGNGTKVWAQGGHAEGKDTMVHEHHEYAHVEGIGTQSTGKASHVEGKYNTGGNFAHVVGNGEEGNPRNAYTLDWSGNAVFAGDVATKNGAVLTQSSQLRAVAIGVNTKAGGPESFACGSGTKASHNQAFAQGFGTTAGAHRAHAEGVNTEVWGVGGHAEGNGTMVHLGHEYAHVEGIGTQSTGTASHVQGKYNTGGDYAHVVGNGEEGNPRNAYTLDWSGNAVFAGKATAQQMSAKSAVFENATITKKAKVTGTFETAGVILTSPNGTQFKITVDDIGSLSIIKV